MKRILLFLATNIAVLFVINITFRILGLDRVVMQAGHVNMTQLLIYAAVIGFSGSLVSLFLSKTMAKRGMGVQVIEAPGSEAEHWLVETVRSQAERAGIGMPEVGVFESPDPNAFATGWNRNNALVAVSTGLLQNMNRGEVEAVLAHEVSHVANGDMVTLAMIQGVVNTFVVFVARIIGMLVDSLLRRGEQDSGPGMGYYIASTVAELVLGVLASMIVMWFSRQREFRADAGGANLAGRRQMIGALRRLQAQHEPPGLPDQRLAAFGIAGGAGGLLGRLMMTHPPLEERIAALEQGR